MSDSWTKPFEDMLPSDTIISPVTAWRIWYVPYNISLELRSFWLTQVPWVPYKRLEADCRNHMTCVCNAEEKFTERGNPATCNAGIYGFKTFDQGYYAYREELENMLGMAAPEPTVNRVAFGKVYLWGKVIECVKGFRGQFGYPAGIYNTADNSPSLTQMYGVPLLAVKDHHRFPVEECR